MMPALSSIRYTTHRLTGLTNLARLLTGGLGLATAIGPGPADAHGPQAEQQADTRRTAAAHVAIAVFVDYRCAHCRNEHAILQRIAARDANIDIAYLDWPILGRQSEEAARIALASRWQGKRTAMIDALFTARGPLDDAGVRTAAASAGVDWWKLQADLKTHQAAIDAELADTARHAKSLGLKGTPALLVGPYLVPGALDGATLDKLISLARQHPESVAR